MAVDKKEKKAEPKAKKFPKELYAHYVEHMKWDEDRLRRYMERNDIPFEE